MSAFDPKAFQQYPNGPLTADVVKKLVEIKERTGVSYATLGSKLGFSGTFTYNLMLKSANVGTQHVERIAEALARMESGEEPATSEPVAEGAETLEHPFHLRPDLQITLRLPADLTDREAERIARFVQSLPVG